MQFDGRKLAHAGNDRSKNDANKMLVSHLCQSKNSEVLNNFHPESGGGLTVPLKKCRERVGESIPQAGCVASQKGPEILLSRRYHRKTGVGPLGMICRVSRRTDGGGRI